MFWRVNRAKDEDLEDSKWCAGKGRNADVGMWDERSRCFWVVSVSDGVDPERYPEPRPRSVRLKRENHQAGGGTFYPRTPFEKSGTGKHIELNAESPSPAGIK